MKRSLILATGLVALAAAPALAGGAAQPAPGPVTVAPTPVVSGNDWTGFSVGAQLGYADVDTSNSLSGDDVLYGVRAYYDYDFGDFVLGGGLQYDATNLDIGGATTLDSVTRVGARAGIDLGQNWLYGTAGYARADTSSLGNGDGWFAGVGYEVLVTDAISIGTEVLYHEFDDFDLAPGLEVDATTAAVSVNFRF
jgi:opacity protein-like surface antigen